MLVVRALTGVHEGPPPKPGRLGAEARLLALRVSDLGGGRYYAQKGPCVQEAAADVWWVFVAIALSL